MQPKKGSTTSPVVQKTDTTIQEKTVLPALTQKEEKVVVTENKKKRPLTKQNQTAIKKQASPETTPIVNSEENSIAQVSEEKLIEAAPAVTAAPAKKPMKLTFTLPTLERKREENEEVIVAAAEEKKTTLQKAATVAHEIRTGDVLGNLREAKDDLFALEFRKDKTKKQQ